MEHYHNYLVGIVIICPTTNTQIALHKDKVEFKYWDAGEMVGDEVDIQITECPLCKTKHILTVPLTHWG